jgi:aminoglycoside phosphotransferase (APT) family kinase protein
VSAPQGETADVTMVGTIAVPADDIIDPAAVAAWMAVHVPGTHGPVRLAKFKGGQSNPTYRVDTATKTYVLRRQPFGKLLPSAHAVDREYRLIAGLHPTGFPVPAPYGLCEDRGVIGSMFYMMEMVEGRSLWDGALPGMATAQRRATYEAMLDTLAALHNTDYAAAGLGDYGKPGNYFERQVARWTKQYRASETEHMADVEALIEWLPATLPEQTRTSVVHGDFRIDNMIFAAGEPRVIAVLDWELSTLGDPLADFSYFLMNWVTQPEGRSGVMGLAGAQTGIPTMEAMVDRYCAATGRSGVPQLDWYFAYNLFRLTGIVQGIKKRIVDGTASSAQAQKTAERVHGLAAAAWSFAKRAGA